MNAAILATAWFEKQQYPQIRQPYAHAAIVDQPVEMCDTPTVI
jgi:hypothetical protein